MIEEVFPCKDGLVRAAKVKTSLGYFVRPINKLYLLEGSSEAQLADVTVSNDDESQGDSQEDGHTIIPNSSDSLDLTIPQVQTTRIGRRIKIPVRLDL